MTLDENSVQAIVEHALGDKATILMHENKQAAFILSTRIRDDGKRLGVPINTDDGDFTEAEYVIAAVKVFEEEWNKAFA